MCENSDLHLFNSPTLGIDDKYGIYWRSVLRISNPLGDCLLKRVSGSRVIIICRHDVQN